jgi:hypothetical protein
LQHDGINVPDDYDESHCNQPRILVPEIEPHRYSQANDKTAQVHEFIGPGARFPFDRGIEILYDSEARIGTSSTLIPVIALCGKAFEPADAQSFVKSTIAFKVPQIEIGQISQLKCSKSLVESVLAVLAEQDRARCYAAAIQFAYEKPPQCCGVASCTITATH